MDIYSTAARRSHIEYRIYLNYIRNNLNMDFQGLSDRAESISAVTAVAFGNYLLI